MTTDNSKFYGIGLGSAQVVDTSGIDRGYAQIMARQQAQRQLELKQLTDRQAQLKPDGLRNDADRKDFFNGVQDWRDKAIAATQERNPYKRSLLKSQADQAYLQAQDLVSRSKQQAAQDQAFGSQLLNPTVRDRYTPDAVNQYLANKQLGVNNPALIKDYNALHQVADHSKTLKEIDELNKGLLGNSQWGTPVLTNQKVGNRNATFISNSRTVDPALQLQRYKDKYTVDQNMRETLNDVYPEIGNNHDLSPEQKRDALLGQFIKDHGPISENKAPIEKVDAPPDKFYEHYKYRINHPLPGQVSSQFTPAQILVGGNPSTGTPGMLQGDPESMKRLVNLAPKTQYGKSAIPEPIVDPNTGEHVFKFPAQVAPDKKAIEDNAKLKAQYAKKPEKEGGILGFGGKVIPFEKSKLAAGLKPEYTVKKDAQEYRLNPADPNGYFGKAEQMAKEQNISLTGLNQIQGGKGGHGIIPTATTPKATTPSGTPVVNKHKKAASDYGL